MRVSSSVMNSDCFNDERYHDKTENTTFCQNPNSVSAYLRHSLDQCDIDKYGVKSGNGKSSHLQSLSLK